MSQIDSSIELQSSAPVQASEQSALSKVIMELSPPQQAALGALAGGQTFSSAAESAGVSRMTLWRWLRSDPAFAEAYQQWKLELRETAEAQLLRVGEQAVAAVARAAEAGDAKIGLAILREMGILRSAGRCTDPRDQPIE
ncbi:MAG TPA: hypothetical protein VK797_06250 [Tepidisphaeraceae bacterium]|nr:hypothetical protein [Tepidisphaeraceae bacterium]